MPYSDEEGNHADEDASAALAVFCKRKKVRVEAVEIICIEGTILADIGRVETSEMIKSRGCKSHK